MKKYYKSAVLFSLTGLLSYPSPSTANTATSRYSIPSTLVDLNHYYKNTYDESDAHFALQFAKLKKSNSKAQLHEFQYSEGTIKSYFIPAKSKQQSLLVMISGTHGIEAFTGSAVQRWLLDQEINTENTAILMIHGLNLFGFKNFRRVNEHNIDLNRNFILDRNKFQSHDEKYMQLNSFLNPNYSPSLSLFDRIEFFYKALINILKYSMESLRSSILKGQYSYPNGLFFGGTKNEIQSHLITDLIQNFMKPYKKIFLIDLHTGYGERSKLHLLAGKSTDNNSTALLKVFTPEEVDFADKKNFYAVNGELLDYFINEINQTYKTETIGIVFEYGTMDSHKIGGSVESLRRVILENQNFHYPASPDTSTQIKSIYKEMFYPSDQVWRTTILQQTEVKMKKIFQYLEK